MFKQSVFNVDTFACFQACNFIVESIWFGCSAWIEDDAKDIGKNKEITKFKEGRGKVTKGNITEQSLLKFMIQNFY